MTQLPTTVEEAIIVEPLIASSAQFAKFYADMRTACTQPIQWGLLEIGSKGLSGFQGGRPIVVLAPSVVHDPLIVAHELSHIWAFGLGFPYVTCPKPDKPNFSKALTGILGEITADEFMSRYGFDLATAYENDQPLYDSMIAGLSNRVADRDAFIAVAMMVASNYLVELSGFGAPYSQRQKAEIITRSPVLHEEASKIVAYVTAQEIHTPDLQRRVIQGLMSKYEIRGKVVSGRS